MHNLAYSIINISNYKKLKKELKTKIYISSIK